MVAPEPYLQSSALFLKLLGGIFFIALSSLGLQIKGLIGREGILPLKEFIERAKRSPRVRRWRLPMLFWYSAEDRFIQAVFAIGLIAAFLLMLGILPPLQLLILFVVYLSIIYAGQDFLSFGWELFLIEIHF